MSVHDLPAPRKLSRWGLYLPFVLLLLFILAWSGFWISARRQILTRLDSAAADWKGAGVLVTWKERTVGGYPFRLDVTLTDLDVRDPSGWALQTPRLEGEAYLHAVTHWVLAAPQGLSIQRPVGGPIKVHGQVLHASLTNLDRRPPSLSFEGLKVAFEPAPGAQPFALTSAERVEFHLRAGPDDEGGIFASVEAGRASPSGVLAQIAGLKPVALTWNSTLSKMSEFQGQDWPSAVRRWSAAGGKLTLRQGALSAGDAAISASGGALSVGADGRASGSLPVTLRQGPRALRTLGQMGLIPTASAEAAALVAQARQGGGDTAAANLTFQVGQTTLGPVAIAPSPKIYDRR